MPAQRVSVIIACRNEAGHVGDLLRSVSAQRLPPDTSLEVLIADGMSEDGTWDILVDASLRDGRIHPFLNAARIVSTGLNEAIRRASGEWILRMDAHTVYAPDYIAECLSVSARTGADNVGGPARTIAHTPFQNVAQMVYHSRLGSGGACFHNPGYEGPVDTVCYGCWKRETLLDLGGFDECLVRNQDDELNLRLTRRGGRIWQSPRIQSWVAPRSSLGRLFRQYLEYGYWKVFVIRKHRLPASWRHLVPALFVAALSALLLAAPVSAMAGTLLLLLVALYAAIVLATSAVLCGQSRRWTCLAELPLAFAAVHLAYGIGFWVALFDLFLHRHSFFATPAAGVASR